MVRIKHFVNTFFCLSENTSEATGVVMFITEDLTLEIGSFLA